MPVQMAVNARYKHRRVTGVERYAEEISIRLFPPIREIRPFFRLPPLLGHAWEQLILPARVHSGEILWSPANSGPWILRQQALTLHDASVFDHSEWFKPTFAAWTRLSWKVLARRVKAIITVSNFSRERLQHHLQIPEEKIHVIPNGVGLPFEPRSAKAIEEARGKYKLTKPYFLFVGTLEPRKNLSALMEAWKDSGLSEHYSLAIAGTKGTVFVRANHREDPAPGVTYLGYVTDSDLPALYSGATAAIVPSLYEGFGLAALEGMACGALVIASNNTSFPEVVGDAGILVNPNDPNEIGQAMHRAIEDRALADQLRDRGLKRARQLKWADAAHQTQQLVENLG